MQSVRHARTWAGATLLVLATVVAGCGDSPTAPDDPIDVTVTLAPGQSVTVPGASTTLKFVEVTGDSRCPADALCILGGSATILVEVTDAAATRRYEFHTGNPQPVVHGAFTLTLRELSPYPFSARPIEPHEYRLTLRVTR